MLTTAQLQAFKADIAANATVIPNDIPGQWVGVQIKNITPGDQDGAFAIATFYNRIASPNFWVWKSYIDRATIYYTVDDANGIWDFGTYKGQTQVEHDTWRELFMGDAADPSKLNFRNGVFNIFSGGTGASATQRAHVFAVCRELATRIEKLLATAPVSAGGIAVGSNNGNVTTDANGTTTNPFVNNVPTDIAYQDVLQAWATP